MQADVKAVVAATPNQDRGRREVAVEDTRPMAVRNGLNNLLQDPEALIEGELRLVAEEAVQRKPTFKSFEQHRRAKGGVVDERAISQNSGMLTDSSECTRLALGRALELGAPFS